MNYDMFDDTTKKFFYSKLNYIITVVIQIFFIFALIIYIYTTSQGWTMYLYSFLFAILIFSYLSIFHLCKYTRYRIEAMNEEDNFKLSIIDSTETIIRTIFSKNKNNVMSGGSGDNNLSQKIPRPPPSYVPNLNTELGLKTPTGATPTVLGIQTYFSQIISEPMKSNQWIILGFIFFLFVLCCVVFLYIYTPTYSMNYIAGMAIFYSFCIYVSLSYITSPMKEMGTIVSIGISLFLIFLLVLYIYFTQNYKDTFTQILFFTQYMSVVYIPFILFLGIFLYQCIYKEKTYWEIIYYIVYGGITTFILFVTLPWLIAMFVLIALLLFFVFYFTTRK